MRTEEPVQVYCSAVTAGETRPGERSYCRGADSYVPRCMQDEDAPWEVSHLRWALREHGLQRAHPTEEPVCLSVGVTPVEDGT